MDLLLLHGAWCGAWCWSEVIAALAERGLRAVAPDLPGEDPDAELSDYLAAASAPLRDGDEPIVVGHSLAGVLLQPLAEARAVRRLVYLAALIPRTGMSMRDQWRSDPQMLRPGWDRGLVSDERRRTRWADRDAAIDVLWPDCPPAAARAAAERLRPQAWGIADEPFGGRHAAPSTYVSAVDDRLFDSSWFRERAPALLGTEPVLLPGGHTPMLSRPHQLAELLSAIGGS